jgi:hypothetical protein
MGVRKGKTEEKGGVGGLGLEGPESHAWFGKLFVSIYICV